MVTVELSERDLENISEALRLSSFPTTHSRVRDALTALRRERKDRQ